MDLEWSIYVDHTVQPNHKGPGNQGSKTHFDGHKLQTQSWIQASRLVPQSRRNIFLPVGTKKIWLESNAILLQLCVFHTLDPDNSVNSLSPCLNKIYSTPQQNWPFFSNKYYYRLLPYLDYWVDSLIFLHCCWFTLTSILQLILDYELLAWSYYPSFLPFTSSPIPQVLT